MSVAAPAPGWANRHGVTLDATLIDKNADGEAWLVTATTTLGCVSSVITTDGSYTPDAYDQLFGVWADCPPCPAEFREAVRVLGTEAVAEVALLVDW